MNSSYRKPKAQPPKPKVDPKDRATQPKPTLSIPNITIRPIEASKLISSQSYQRPVNQKNVKCIKEGYVKELVNPVKVSLRNQKYYVFDGQHTLTVLTEMFGSNCIIPCIVYTGMTYEREAELFAKQDEFKKKLNAREQYKALYEGKDEEMTRFVNICTECGFVCNLSGGSSAPLKISNVKYMYEVVFKKRGEKHLRRLLGVLKGAYPEDKDGMNDNIIKGLDIFMTMYDGEYSDENLVNSLRKVSPVVIRRNAGADMTHSGATRYAVQIFDLYNKGKTAKAKIRSKF